MFTDMQAGFGLATNLFDLYKNTDGSLELGFLNENGLRMSPHNVADVEKWRHLGNNLTWKQAGWGAVNATGGIGLSFLSGYSTNGMQGGVNAITNDVATHAALMKYHFMPAASRTQGAGLAAPGLISGMGSNASTWSRLRNTAGYATKGVAGGLTGMVGGMIGGAIGRKMFGGVGEFSGNIGGTVLGAYGGVAAMSALSTPVGAVAGLGLGTLALGTTAAVGGGLAAGYGAYQTLKNGYYHRQMQKGIHTSGSLAAFHTNSAQTMRQRAVQAISKSHLNARSALGQEASLMSMPSRNYHSRYRRFY